MPKVTHASHFNKLWNTAISRHTVGNIGALRQMVNNSGK